MGIEKVVQYLNRKPSDAEIAELLELEVINRTQAQDLQNYHLEGEVFELRQTQRLALVQLLRENVVFIDDDTGSGKTVIASKAIAALDYELGAPTNALFWTPNTIKPQWRRRVLSYWSRDHIYPLTVDDILVIGETNGNGYDRIADSRVVIVNYERIARGDSDLISAIQDAGFTFVNFDEFQRAKNPEGMTARYLMEATEGIPYRMATTASPYRKSLTDPATLIAILNPEFYREEQRREIGRNPRYAEEYRNMTPEQQQDLARFVIGKYVRGEGVADVRPLRAQFANVRRWGRSQSTEELTGKKVTIDYEIGAYDLSEPEAEVYEKFRNADVVFPEVVLEGTQKLDALRYVLSDVSVLTPQFVKAKIDERKAVREQKTGRAYKSIYTSLDEIFEAHPEMRSLGDIESSRYQALRNVLNHIPLDEEVIVFIERKEGVIDNIQTVLNEHYGGEATVKITGDVSTDARPGRYFGDREIAMLRVQVSEGIMGAVAMSQVAGEGVRFDRARNMVIYDLPYTWDDIKQDIGREEGPNQTRDINVYVVNERTRVDQGIIKLINDRKEVGRRFRTGATELTEEEVMSNLVDRPTAEEKQILPYLQSDLDILMRMMGSMKERGFKENYQLLRDEKIGDESASAFFARAFEYLENGLPGNMSRLVAQMVQGLDGKGRIADMGSGIGFLERTIDEYRVGVTVTSLDMNIDALHYAKQKDNPRSKGHIVSDIGAASLQGDRFDYAVASLSLQMQNLDDRVSALKEMFRVVKPGGYVIISEKDDYLTDEHKGRWKKGIGDLGGRVSELSGAYKSHEGRFGGYVIVAQKVSEPGDIDSEDFLFGNTPNYSSGEQRDSWGPGEGQRCDTFIHEDGTVLEDKVQEYKAQEQEKTAELTILGYEVVVLGGQEAREFYRQKFGRRLREGESFISPVEDKVYTNKRMAPDQLKGVLLSYLGRK
ncbi:MAG: methyltransferase domain-containing protein [archaeon]